MSIELWRGPTPEKLGQQLIDALNVEKQHNYAKAARRGHEDDPDTEVYTKLALAHGKAAQAIEGVLDELAQEIDQALCPWR